MADLPDVAAQLAALRARFASELDGRLAALFALAVDDAAAMSPERLQAIGAKLHQLAGAGGTFGYAELSGQAKALEIPVRQWLEAATPVPQADWQRWREALFTLKGTAALPGHAVAVVAGVRIDAFGAAGRPYADSRIALVMSQAQDAADLMRGLTQFGYALQHFTTLDAAGPALRADPPDAALVELPARDEAGALLRLAEWRRSVGERTKLVALTGGLDFALELQAAQAGADACLALSVDAPTAAACIDVLLGERDQPPVRVLVVDDDETVGEHNRLLFTQAGMLAEYLGDPLTAREALERLRPDVLLMDLQMPRYSGADVARAIRFDPAWQSLPIVFLSAETDTDLQLRALAVGADDFISKSVGGAELVAIVRSRAVRARKLSTLMSQDSLTGLLKHAMAKDRLAQEVDRANRQGKTLVVAMVDIDHFKKVNDDWGHLMGDHVIKTLAQLLRQRLRRQDSVGRYGGEEFVLILPDCSLDDAQRLLHDIRLRFAEVQFGGHEKGFSVTFSAGIASNEHLRQAEELLAAADAAMYEAKRGGRNQVRRADRAGRVSP